MNAIDDFARQYITTSGINQARFVVALHNNTDGKPFTVRNVASGKNLHLQAGADEDDFFIVMNKQYFDALSKRGFNVALAKTITGDDGSFFVYAVRNNISYINVEAQYDHLDEQVRMLRALMEVIGLK